MYQWSENQVMPLGPGILWIPTSFGFRKSIMTSGTSFGAVQWLQWIQQSDFCVDCQGHRIQLHHSYHQGEMEINGYKIDGYLKKDGKEFFFEYNGNYRPYHMVHMITC